MNGKIIVICASSGTGKSTLIEMVRKDYPALEWSVSYTTRPIREGEVHGQDYFFVSQEEFLKMRENGEFVEWAQVHANYYGTSSSFLKSKIDQGLYVLMDIDVQGADSIKGIFKDQAQVIFIIPPSIEILEKRLRKRNTDSDDVIQRRVHNAIAEQKRMDDFDYKVLNDQLTIAHKDLKEIISDIILNK